MIQYTPTSLSLDFINNLAVVNGEDYALNKNLTPARPNAFDNLITFSRGSLGTVTDATGRVTYAPNNLQTYSESFDAVWAKTNSTVIADAITAPNKSSTADMLIASAGSGTHRVSRNSGWASSFTVLSVYAKAGTHSFFQIYDGASTENYATFNLSIGTIGAQGSNTTASIVPVGDGWYRCSAAFGRNNSIPIGNSLFGLTNTATAAWGSSWTATGNETIYLWGAQLEAVTYQTTPGTYIATTSAAYYGPRFDYDPVSLAPKGLLVEEQRTNLLLRSEEFDNASWVKTRSSITANVTTSPDGTVDVDKLVEDTTASNTHQVGQAFSATNGTSYSFSVYLKAAERTWAFLQLSSNMFADATSRSAYVNLSTGAVGNTVNSPTVTVVDAGGGWWRVIMTATATASAASAGALIYLATGNGGLSYTGDGTSGIFVWGAQLEAGAFATSYIPTVASQVTRTADVAAITGANFSQWYNQSAGTFVVEFDTSWTGNAPFSMGVIGFDASASKRVIYIPSGTQVAGSFDGASAVAGNNVVPGPSKVASAYSATGRAISTNGTAVASGSVAAGYSSATSLLLGAFASYAILNGYIRNIQYYPQRLPNAVLQQLTT